MVDTDEIESEYRLLHVAGLSLAFRRVLIVHGLVDSLRDESTHFNALLGATQIPGRDSHPVSKTGLTVD